MTNRALTIGVDVAETEGQMTGVGRYTVDLLEAWLDQEAANFVLFARHADRVPRGLAKRAEVVSSEAAVGVVRWQQFKLPFLLRRRPVDLLFCPAYAVPLLSSTPSVVALHDLSFERDRESFSRREGWRRRTLARRSAAKARGVVTISDFSKNEIQTLYGIDQERVQRVYPSCDRERFRPAGGSNVAEISRKPYLLSVGTLLTRRHVDALLRAFAGLPARFSEHELVVVGKNLTRPRTDFLALAARLGVADRLRTYEHMEEQDLVALYQHTDLLVSLSDYEGFGLPVLEALCCGAPVLVLDIGVYKELWSGVAHTVESVDPVAVGQAIVQAAGKPAQQSTIDALVEQQFNRQQGAAKVLRFLQTCAPKHP